MSIIATILAGFTSFIATAYVLAQIVFIGMDAVRGMFETHDLGALAALIIGLVAIGPVIELSLAVAVFVSGLVRGFTEY